jgi:hypothetical protein
MTKHDESSQEVESLANSPAPSLASEFWQFLRHNKKWWLLPIVAVLLFFGLLIALAGTGAAPLIYTFF